MSLISQIHQETRATLIPKILIVDMVMSLSEGPVEFEYLKKDGSKRHALGTTNKVCIRSDGAEPKGEREPYDNGYVRYYDLEKNAWRQFHICKLLSYERFTT